MKLIALLPIQHDNVFYGRDEVLEVEDSGQAEELIEVGAARKAPESYPVSEGVVVKRKPVKDKDKIVPTKKQIEEAEKAAEEADLDPQTQFEKGAIAQSAVAAGDVTKIKEAREHRRK